MSNGNVSVVAQNDEVNVFFGSVEKGTRSILSLTPQESKQLRKDLKQAERDIKDPPDPFGC